MLYWCKCANNVLVFFFTFWTLFFVQKTPVCYFCLETKAAYDQKQQCPLMQNMKFGWSLVHFSRFQNIAVGGTCHENKCMCPEKSHRDLLSILLTEERWWQLLWMKLRWCISLLNVSRRTYICGKDHQIVDSMVINIMLCSGTISVFVRKHFWRWSAFWHRPLTYICFILLAY